MPADWGSSRVAVGADVGPLSSFCFSNRRGVVGASGALLGIAMEEKTSNKIFNGMVEGHPALLRANHKLSKRAVFNNSEAHKHDASQGDLFRTKGAKQGIPGVAGSPIPKVKFTRRSSGVPGQNLNGTKRKRRTTAVTAEAEAPNEK